MTFWGGVFTLWCIVSFNASGFVKAKASWVSFRDSNIIKQGFDFSCGAASLATILTFFYNDPTTEGDVLEKIQKQGASSFKDLKKVSEALNYRAVGIAIGWESLKELKIPVIAHLNYKGQDHFSVLKNIDSTHVHLADPSWGNRKLSHARFKKVFHTRKDSDYFGSILIILR